MADYKKFSGTSDVYRDSAEYNRVRLLSTQFDRYEQYYQPEIDRWILNTKMVWGINFGQWPAQAVEKLINSGRRPPTFNIIGKKVESQVSNFMNNGFKMKCWPANGRIDTLTQKVNKLYESDRNFMQWKVSQRVALRDMFTQVAYERMVIDDRYNSFGNIAWEPVSPGHVYVSPSWKSQSIWDIMDYFDWAEMYVSEISDAFPEIADKLKDQREREEREGVNLGEYHGGPQTYRTSEQKWGSKHRVITFHSLKKEDMWWEYDLKNHCNFPETGFENGSDDDRRVKWQYIQDAGLDPNRDVTPVFRKKRTKYLEVICPTLDAELMLRRGKDKIQTNNCNLYVLGNGYNGQFKSTADELYDVQVSFNKGRMNIDDIKLASARGACFLDRRLAGGNAQLEQQIEENWNIPGARIWVDEGAMADLGPTGGIVPVPRITPSADTYQDNNALLGLADWFSTIPAAMDSRQEGAQESGRLFRSKVQVGLVGMQYGMEIWEAHEQSKAMGYLAQIKITYSGWPRVFNLPGEEPVRINTRATELDPGLGIEKRVTIDDISLLPDMQVLMIPNEGGTIIQQELQQQYGEQLQGLANDPALQLVKTITLEGLFKTFPTPEDQKAELEKAFAMTKKLIAMGMAIDYQMKAQQLAMGPQPPPPEQGGGGRQEPLAISAKEVTPQQAAQGTPQEDRIKAEPIQEPITQ